MNGNQTLNHHIFGPSSGQVLPTQMAGVRLDNYGYVGFVNKIIEAKDDKSTGL